jgi:hypothetical protein
LAADTKRHGGYYDDSRGLRYLPPSLYLKLQDYNGAMRYFRWFAKNFDDDSGYPTFLFEWSITLYKNGRLLDAESMVLLTFFSNNYLIDWYLGKEKRASDIKEQSNWQSVDLLKDFPYSHRDPMLSDFSDWLTLFLSTDKYKEYSQGFLKIQQKLSDEHPGITRSEMVDNLVTIMDKFIVR